MEIKLSTLLTIALTFSSGIAMANLETSRGAQNVHISEGRVLANAEGMTLYTFKKDQEGISNCYEKCATNWPPMLAKEDAKTHGDFDVIKRKDGTFQFTHKDQPLYTFINDKKKMDVTGHNFKNLWEVIPH